MPLDRPNPWLCAGAVALVVASSVAIARKRQADLLAVQRRLAASVPPPPVVSPQGIREFVGSEACAPCHPQIFREHRASLHASTLRPIEEARVAPFFRTRQTLEDPRPGLVYSFALRASGPAIRVERPADGASDELKPRFAVGSGRFGITFLFERDGRFMEGRASYYPPVKRWWWTPGQEEYTFGSAPAGRILNEDTALACFLCHSTAVVRSGGRILPERSIFDVGCERCHGPGRRHVEAMQAGRKTASIYSYRLASPETIMRLCGECHRGPGEIPEEATETSLDLARFAGTALALSRCYRESRGRLSCVTCHDPHRRVSHDRRAYERVCLSCHSGGARDQKPCPVNPTTGCIGCHMARETVSPETRSEFHNHWIGRIPRWRPGAGRETAATPDAGSG